MSDTIQHNSSDTNFILLQRFGTEYLEAASALIETWENSFNIRHHMPIAQLLGHSLELTLKGFLSIAGIIKSTAIPKTHDILSLANNEAIKTLITLSAEELAQLDVLSRAYAKLYKLRYPQLGYATLPDGKGLLVLEQVANRLSCQLDELARQQDFNDPVVKLRIGTAV
jgi:HEPN domain-containing protein